jgi:DNA processing protein
MQPGCPVKDRPADLRLYSNMEAARGSRPSEPNPPPPAAVRELLVALNTLDLHRPTLSRLAASLARWHDHRGPAESLAAGLSVSPASLAKALALRRQASAIAAREEARAAACGARIVVAGEATYPAALTPLGEPPPVLYLRGTLPTRPAVAIVGARHPSPYGREAATLFARDLAAAGVVVVSGFARGIDTAAHEGALLAAGGKTVAVLGCGLDVDYPRHSRQLADRIAEHGAVLSELPCGWAPRAHQFPLRNRLIAALGLGVLVVEARLGSGSLITVRHALDLGREVWVVPGRIFDELALGPNSLARDGATPVLHPRHVLEQLPALAPGWHPDADRSTGAAPAVASLAGSQSAVGPPPSELGERLLATLVPGDPQPVEALAAALGLPIDRVLVCLLELELSGLLERLPGPLYHRSLARSPTGSSLPPAAAEASTSASTERGAPPPEAGNSRASRGG